MSPPPPEPPDFAASQLFLRRLAYSLVRDEARAEDLVQETWATWVERRPSGLAEPRAWLARVLRNRAFNLKRADARRSLHEELAGRPDPSGPETDGTLEAQAQLLEALRKLEEPFRSTLVQRYYHDLAPSAIAERAGAPLNTVKARLARGLEKLRAEMDRRYHGDRRAWCHWLTVLGAPPVPVTEPASPTRAGPLASAASGSSLLGWLGLAAAVVAGGLWKSGWRPAARESAPPTSPSEPLAREPETTKAESARPSRKPDESTSAREGTSAPRPRAPLASSEPAPAAPAPGVAASAAGRDSFEWPQYGGGPTHDNFRAREDEIHAPNVLWFVPGCAGQPTLDGEDLYTGGLTVARLDAATGMIKAAHEEWLFEFLELEVELSELDTKALARVLDLRASLQGLLEDLDPNDATKHAAAGSPVVTSRFVFVRDARDGSVLALNHDLREEFWRWESGWDERVTDSPATRVPLCVTEEDVVLVPLHGVLVALRAKDGRELWRYSVNGAIANVPAAADGRIFLGSDRGLFVALDARTGQLLWRSSTGRFGVGTPVVAGELVLAADVRSWISGSDWQMHAWDTQKGAKRWASESFASSAGIGVDPTARCLYVSSALDVERYELADGKRDDRWDGYGRGSGGRTRGAPAVVGESLVFAVEPGRLSVCGLEGERQLRWAFQLPRGCEVTDFVHTGRRLYVATSIGLFCLADDEEKAAVEPGFVLEWDGDPRLPSYLADEEK